MKSVWKICLLFLCAVFLIVVLFLIVNRNLSREKGTKQGENESAGGVSEDIVTEDTILVVSSFDINEEEETVEEQPIPQELIGRERSGIVAFYDDYLATPDEADLKKGLTNIEIVSFSTKKLIIRKIYDNTLVETGSADVITDGTNETAHYFVKNVDGKITIYYPDTETVYFETGIQIEGLPAELISEIEMGKEIHSVEELYHFLESYTS